MNKAHISETEINNLTQMFVEDRWFAEDEFPTVVKDTMQTLAKQKRFLTKVVDGTRYYRRA